MSKQEQEQEKEWWQLPSAEQFCEQFARNLFKILGTNDPRLAKLKELEKFRHAIEPQYLREVIDRLKEIAASCQRWVDRLSAP